MRLHPWIFSGAIKKINGNPAEGEVVEVYDNKDNFLCCGHYQIGTIAIRIFTFDKEIIDNTFWHNKILAAINYRKNLGFFDSFNSNVFRLINAEGDNLPGLIIDYYNGVAVIQAHSVGMFLILKDITDILKNILQDKLKAVYNKSLASLPYKSKIEQEDGFLFESSNTNQVQEYGNKYFIDWAKGQKTGFFIDQRENRKLLEYYSKDKSVLNMFCYTGGFSVSALKGGAKMVHSVDSSKKAIELTDKNIELNFPNSEKHISFAEDAFDFLDNIKDKYDVIILDPPAFAKHQKALHNALQGYKRLNQKAISQIKPGGIIFTFSCSQAVSKDNFRKSVFVAATNAGRNLRILHQLSQPVDHPISIFHPEGEYLKGLVLYVE